MLSYKPPFLEAGNLTLFRDEVDLNLFYYICNQPSISLQTNGEPVIAAYAILPESGVGTNSESIIEASLMLDINLKAQEKDIELAKKTIQKSFGREPQLLAPAPLYSGKVFFIMAQAGDTPDFRKWFITSEVKPSLFGNNNASLVVKTSGNDAKQLIAALDSDVVPAAVYYELEFIGIAPVFRASLIANWEMIYHHFDSYEKTNYLFYSEEISKAVDSLIETRAIDIIIEETDPDIKAEAAKSLFNELKTEVVKRLFEPVPLPSSKPSESIGNKIGSAISGIFSSIIPGVHYIKRNIDEIQMVTTTINLSQRNAKKYPFYPQSLLSSLINSVGGIRDSIKWIKLDEIPYVDQRVEIRLSADTFKSSNIKSVFIDLRVCDLSTGNIVTPPKSLSFDNDDALQNHFNFTRQKNVKYRYDYKVSMYMVTSSNKLPSKMELDWNSVESPYIYINPAEYFKNYDVDIHLDESSIFTQTHLIQVDVDVKDVSDNEIVMQRTYMFNNDDKEHKRLSVVANINAPLKFDLKLTYFISESKEHTVSFKDWSDEVFFIPNPFENKWTITLFCNADWGKANRIILETKVLDAERVDPIYNKFTFSPQVEEQQLAIECSLDTPKQKSEYRVTVLTLDGGVVQGPWLIHEGPILVVNEKIKAERIIRASIVSAPDFEKKEIKKFTIEFKYEDNNHQISHNDSAVFQHREQTVEFRHPMPDYNQKKYLYRLIIKGMNGESYKTDWITEENERLEITVKNDIW